MFDSYIGHFIIVHISVDTPCSSVEREYKDCYALEHYCHACQQHATRIRHAIDLSYMVLSCSSGAGRLFKSGLAYPQVNLSKFPNKFPMNLTIFLQKSCLDQQERVSFTEVLK